MYPGHRAVWILDTSGSARRVGAAPLRYDLAFIDGDHRHPWPLLDLLHLAPVLAAGAWVALHDVALARILPSCASRGAEWLFDLWPGEKLAGTGDAENIGAVRLPVALAELLPMAVQLIERATWEAQPGPAAVALAEVFAPLSAPLARRLRVP